MLLVIAEPAIKRRLPTRSTSSDAEAARVGRPGLAAVVFCTSVYGGYFGAGQGVILLAGMTLLMSEGLQQINALKNVLQAVDNLTSAAVFAIIANPDRSLVALLAVGSVIGGLLGARLGRALPRAVLRGVIIVVGVYGIVQLSR